MDREKTVNSMSFKDAASKKWYLSMKPASPKETLEVEFDDGKAYKFLGTGQVNVGDPVIIDYGGASSYKMGNVISKEQGITIKRTHALKPLYTFTTDPDKTEIKKNIAAVKGIDDVEDVSSYFDDLYLDRNKDRFHVIDYLVGGVLNAIAVIAFPDLAGTKAVDKAKLFLASEQSVPGIVFSKKFTDTYFAASEDIPCCADTAETSFTGFYPGWKEDLHKCSIWGSEELAKVEKTWDEREQAYYLYYKNGSRKLEKLFKEDVDFKKMTNELVFRSALSILIRGGFKNLLEAALSVEMPIKVFYDELIAFAEKTGSGECCEVLKNTDYKTKTFDTAQSAAKGKPKAQAKKNGAAPKGFVIKDGVLKKYKGKEEIVIIPDGVKTIDESAFDNNVTIKKVIMPDSIKSIKEAAFRSCFNLEEVVFSKGLTSMAPLSFAADRSLKVIDLSNTKIKVIRKKCFIFCENLESVQLPEGLKSIENDAFMKTAIKEMRLPSSLEMVPYNAFGLFNRDIKFTD